VKNVEFFIKSIFNRFAYELCILVFAKKSKNTYPTVWQIEFAFLLTWQILGKNSHICKPSRRLAWQPCVISIAPARAPAHDPFPPPYFPTKL
jgi:hypothetical protein